MTDEAQLQQTVRDALVLAAQTAREMLQPDGTQAGSDRALAPGAMIR